MSGMPGGVKREVTFITEDRPLSLSDPSLENILLNQRNAILQRYKRTVIASKRTATTSGSGGEDDPNSNLIELRPVSYTTQVVAGTNYFVKLEVIHVGQPPLHGANKHYIHIRIFYQPWTGTTQLTGLILNQTLDDAFTNDSFGDQSFEDDNTTTTNSASKDTQAESLQQQLREATSHTSPHVSIRK